MDPNQKRLPFGWASVSISSRRAYFTIDEVPHLADILHEEQLENAQRTWQVYYIDIQLIVFHAPHAERLETMINGRACRHMLTKGCDGDEGHGHIWCL